jgi:altered-inheritance-of-mitochondria protein 13
LRSQEAEILSKINAALEKENLEKERENPGLSSGVLGKDIEGVREKIERMGREKERKEGEGVKSAKGAVVQCYL